MGEIHPKVAKHLNLEEPVFVFEFNMASLVPLVKEVPLATALPKYPAVKRDFALLMDDQIPAGRLTQAIWNCEATRELLKNVEIFDVYKGERLPEGKKSIAFSVVLRAEDRTLTDQEVQNGADELLKTLSDGLGAEIR